MRAGPLSDDRVIERLNRHFIPVYVVNEEYGEGGSAPPEEKAARLRIFRDGRAAGLSVGTVHVYLLEADGRLRESMHVAGAARTERLVAMLDRTIGELRVAPGEPVVVPAPQSAPPSGSDGLVLHLVARSLDGRGAWSEFPVENWIVLSPAAMAKLIPASPFEPGQRWRLDESLAKTILTHFYPATENNDVSTNEFERVEVEARIAEARPDRVLVRLDGRMRMFHKFYHKPDGRMVEASLTGYAEIDPTRNEVLSLEIVTTRATYNGGEFAIGVRSLRHDHERVESGPASPRFEIEKAVALPCRDCDGIALGDLTGNGRMDILASEGKHGVTVWFEQGEDWTQWTRRHIHTIEGARKEIEGNALGDFNGDGRLEAISLDQANGRIYLHRHSGDPRGPWKTAVIQTDRPLLQDALVTDIDHDGRPDLVYTWEGRAPGEGGVHWLKLVGDDPLAAGDWRDHVMARHESAWWLAPARADISGNGRPVDIVFTARHLRTRNPGARPGVFWMEPGEDVTRPWIVHVIDDTLDHPLHVDMGDLSGQGHGLDLVVSGFNTDRIYWYDFSDGWRRHDLPLPPSGEVQPDRVWNVKTVPMETGRDAILAPVARGSRGTLLLYVFSEGRFQPQVLRTLDYGHPMDDRILLHDLSGDGRPEILVPDSGPGVNTLWIFRLGKAGSF